jgi:signal transduction histidine kinase
MIECSTSTNGVHIDIDDDGPGIPLADRGRVFEPFVRLDDSTRRAGLGLTLVRRIVGNFYGTVAVLESSQGGCRFSLPALGGCASLKCEGGESHSRPLIGTRSRRGG